MTMTDRSPPLSPQSVKTHDSIADSQPSVDMTLPHSAINRSLYYHFPTPPQSPSSPTYSCSPRVTSPRRPSLPGIPRPKHVRNASRNTSINHARRRSSLSMSFHISQLMESEYGPPPHPAPTAPLPPVPGAPRIPFTTPAQERQRYSSYELFDKLRLLELRQKEDMQRKRHSAPPLKTGISPIVPTTFDIRRTVSDNATVGRTHEVRLFGQRRRSSNIGVRPLLDRQSKDI